MAGRSRCRKPRGAGIPEQARIAVLRRAGRTLARLVTILTRTRTAVSLIQGGMAAVPSSWIGQSIRRREDARLLRGQGRYVSDLPLPAALEAAVLRSPHAHARITRLDASAAMSLPGIVAILDGPSLASRLAPLTTAHWRTPPAVQE